MKLIRKRWSKVYESTEEELVEFLKGRGLEHTRIIGKEMSIIDKPSPKGTISLWCAEGSLYVQQFGNKLSLQPGDVVQVSDSYPYKLFAGISGFVCYVTK